MNNFDFVGSILSLDCGDSLGTFQGEVTEVNKEQQSISLKKPYRNGIKFDIPEITIRAVDIRDLKILKSFEEQESLSRDVVHPPQQNGRNVAKTSANATPTSKHKAHSNGEQQRTAKKNERQNSATKTPTKQRTGTPNQNGPEVVKAAIYSGTLHSAFQRVHKDADVKDQGSADEKEAVDDKGKKQKYLSGNVEANHKVRSSPRKIEGGQKQRRNVGANARNAECFSAPVESFLATDFDFDKSRESFNKAAIFEEISSTLASGDDRKVKNIPHNEDILLDNVPAFIHDKGGGQVKCSSYVSESGVTVPAVTADTIQSLYQAADKLGLTAERRLESAGVCISGMVLNIIDSNNIREKHRSSVVVACGPHLQGAQGINCARHLANHNAEVFLFIPNFAKMPELLVTELRTFKETGGKHITNVKDLPEEPPDMIISALDTPTDTTMSKQPWHKSIVAWITASKASILSIDPVPNHAIRSKWSMITALPLSYDNTNPGMLYLCDVGIPAKVFSTVGVDYTSPYRNKFVVRLHNRY